MSRRSNAVPAASGAPGRQETFSQISLALWIWSVKLTALGGTKPSKPKLKIMQTLKIGQVVQVQELGDCTVKSLAFNGLLSKHYMVATCNGAVVRVCYNPLLKSWQQYSSH